MSSITFAQYHKEVREILNKVRFTHTEHSPCSVISGITKFIVIIGCISLLAIVLFVLHAITSTTLLLVVEISVAACLMLYSLIAFCVMWNRHKLIKVYRRYPYAVDILKDFKGINNEDIPSFFQFHKVIYDDWYYDHYMSICAIPSRDLKTLNNGVSILNRQLRSSCSKNRDQITRFLINTCSDKANDQSTYTKLYAARSLAYKIKSVKQIFVRSFKSDFAFECVSNIVNNSIADHHLKEIHDSGIIANENDIYVFYESDNKKIKPRIHVLLFLIPFLLFLLPSLYMAGKYRKIYVEEILRSNIYNEKIADAVIAKLDIMELHIQDSIAFENLTTVPLEYSIHYKSYDSAPYVGEIYSVGKITYNGKDYGRGAATLMYTYGTDITITSYSKETDDVPASDRRVEIVNFSKTQLRNPCQVKHILTIIENRGRYAGYAAGEYFEYSFLVNGPELPADEAITNTMLDTYDRSHEDIDINKLIKDYFFEQVLQFSAEDVLEEKISEYLCASVYKLNVSCEVEKMKNLVENRAKYDNK